MGAQKCKHKHKLLKLDAKPLLAFLSVSRLTTIIRRNIFLQGNMLSNDPGRSSLVSNFVMLGFEPVLLCAFFNSLFTKTVLHFQIFLRLTPKDEH